MKSVLATEHPVVLIFSVVIHYNIVREYLVSFKLSHKVVMTVNVEIDHFY